MAASSFTELANRRKNGRVSASKLAPDMTPLVGLGFLLVTFFLLAANFAKPAVLQLSMPVRPIPDDQASSFVCGGAITLLLGKNHQIHYFLGMNDPYDERPALHSTNFGPLGLRQILLKLQQERPNDIVLIKTTADAKYKDMVDVLDEMNITNQKKYAMVDMYAEDVELLKLNAL